MRLLQFILLTVFTVIGFIFSPAGFNPPEPVRLIEAENNQINPCEIYHYSGAFSPDSPPDFQPGSAFVIAGDAPPEIINTASFLRNRYGELVQFCDGQHDEQQLQAAINALPGTGGTVYLSDGRFNFSSTVILRSNLMVMGSDSTTVYFSPTGQNMFENEAGYAPFAANLADNLPSGQSKVVVSNPTGYSVNAWVKIVDNNIIGGNETGKQGELARIKSIVGNALFLDHPVTFSYSTAQNATIRIIGFTENITLKNLHIIGPGTGTSSYLANLFTVNNFTLEDCFIENFGEAAISLTDCSVAGISKNTFSNIYKDGTGYSIVLYNATEHVRINSNDFVQYGRHYIAQGARSNNIISGGIVRNVEITNNNFKNSTLAAIDAHAPYYGPLIIRDNYFLNCFNGIAAYNANLEISNNIFENCAVGINIPEGTEARLTLISGNRIIGGTYGIKVRSSNIDIVGNEFVDCGIYAVKTASKLHISGNIFQPETEQSIVLDAEP